MIGVFAKYPAVFAVAFVVTLLLTPLIASFAARLGLIDRPDARRMHKGTVPRCGGIAVFLGFHAGCAAVYLLPWPLLAAQMNIGWWQRFAAVSALVLALGLADDRFRLRPWAKFAGQAAIAAAAYAWGMHAENMLGVRLPGWLDMAVTVFWFVACMNAFNLVDGMDGVASGLAAIAAAAIAGKEILLHAPNNALIALALIGACVAFLRYNFHPASVFLGDGGSMFLGAAVAALSLQTGSKAALAASVGIPIMAVGVPAIDTFLAIWRRAARGYAGAAAQSGSGVFAPDLDHLHHRLHRLGLSVRQVALALYVFAGALVAVGLLSSLLSSRSMGVYLLAFVAGLYVVVRHLAHVELWETSSAIANGIARPPGTAVTVIVYPLLDIAAMGAALAASLWAECRHTGAADLRARWLGLCPVWVGIPFILLVVAQTYRRVWSRARVAEYLLTAAAAAGGVLIAAGGTIIAEDRTRPVIALFCIYAAWAVSAVIGLRILPRALLDGLMWLRARWSPPDDGSTRVLLCGAGQHCTLFLRARALGLVDGAMKTHVIGIVDDDPNLRGRFVHGYEVKGGLDRIASIARTQKVGQIVVTEPLTPEARRLVDAAASTRGIPVLQWQMGLQPEGADGAPP